MGITQAAVRNEIEAFLPQGCLQQLHKPNFALDIAATLILIIAPYIVIATLALIPMNSAVQICISVFQGWLFLACALLAHDQMIHRKVYGPSLSRFLGAILFLPSSQRATRYRYIHFAHHRFTNSTKDTEFYKTGLVTTNQRLAFCTAIGYVYLKSRIQRGLKNINEANLGDAPTTLDTAWLRFERALQVVAILAALALSVYEPRAFFFGIALPFLLWTPTANMCRLVGDHAVRDPSNDWWSTTFFKPNSFSKILFLYDAGEHHFIHHIFPLIPFYRMEKAGSMLRPLFESKGIDETRSHLQLIRMWIFDGKPHGQLWR